MNTIANYLMAMSLAGYFKENDWKKWAENKINTSDSVEDWVYDVRDANNIDHLKKALEIKVNDEEFYSNNNFQFSDAIIGFYYLRYINSELSLEDLLYLSNEEACSGDTLVPSERFSELLSKLEENRDLMNNKDFILKIQKFYKKFKEVSERQLEAI